MKKYINKIKKSFFENNKILKDEFKHTFPRYILGIFVNGIQAIFHFLIPYVIGEILDLLLKGNIDKDYIMGKVYKLILVSCLSVVPRFVYRTLFFTQARISDTRLRKKVLEHLQYVKPEYYEKEDKGAFLSYLSKELLAIRKFLGNFFFEIGKLILNPIVVLVVVAIKYNYIIALAEIPILLAITIYIFKLYSKLNEKVEFGRKTDVELSKTIEQNTSGFLVIKQYNEQENQLNKFRIVNEQRKQADYEIGIVKNKIKNGVNIMYGACYCVLFGLGLILIKNNMLTVGALTALITCMTFVISEITSSVEPLINGVAYFKQSTKRYNYFLGLETYKSDGLKLKNEKINKISISDLSYSYDSINYCLDNINIDIKKGEKIGIIGQVGSGKTTLMNIISGFLEVPNEMIYINGVDINEYARDEIFKNIGYSTQKNIILDDTLKNNINLVNDQSVNVEKLAKLSELYPDIIQMDDKFDTIIGENGNRLSGGQKQRVQIARSLSCIRSVNIYDDTLSALDSNTENKVLDSIISETRDNILIVVSNKVSSMQNLDRIYMLIDGKIYDSGTHEELLIKNKLYKEMYDFEKAGDLM